MQELQAQSIQSQGKVINNINTIKLKACAKKNSYYLKNVMYRNSYEVSIVTEVEKQKLKH